MSEAFRCASCGQYHDGKPTYKLYKWSSVHKEYHPTKDLCDNCTEVVEGQR